MAVLKMQRITVCALKKDRKAILEKIQSMGVLQVDPVLEDDSDFTPPYPNCFLTFSGSPNRLSPAA